VQVYEAMAGTLRQPGTEALLAKLVRRGCAAPGYHSPALAQKVQFLAEAGQPVEPALFEDRDLAAIARAAGAQGVTVRAVAALALLRDWLGAPSDPMLLDCKIDPWLRAAWFQQVVVPDSWFQRMVTH
jgi:hypothetical protein